MCVLYVHWFTQEEATMGRASTTDFHHHIYSLSYLPSHHLTPPSFSLRHTYTQHKTGFPTSLTQMGVQRLTSWSKKQVNRLYPPPLFLHHPSPSSHRLIIMHTHTYTHSLNATSSTKRQTWQNLGGSGSSLMRRHSPFSSCRMWWGSRCVIECVYMPYIIFSPYPTNPSSILQDTHIHQRNTYTISHTIS